MTYNTTIASSPVVKVNGIKVDDVAMYINYGITFVEGRFEFAANYEDFGKNTTYEIAFYEDGALGEMFTIVIDTSMPAVNLRDFSTYKERNMKVANNLSDEELKTFVADSIVAGIMNLSWAVPQNNYFIYTYTLRELNSNTETNLFGGYQAISDGGTYQFVIKVFAVSGEYLGNRVYAFSIAGDNELLYYVKDASGKAIDSNSNFKLRAIDYYDYLYGAMLAKGDINGESDIPLTNLPLYIVKEVDGQNPVSVVVNEDLVINKPDETKGEIIDSKYTFYFYQVKTSTHSQFFGVLIVKESSMLVSNAQIDGTQSISALNTSFVLADNNKNAIKTISATHSAMSSADYLLSRNNMVVEMYYNRSNEPTKIMDAEVVYNPHTYSYESNFSYNILGNGYYTFVFKDKAGNTHLFGDNSIVQVTVLREVVVFINNSAPIENAYYNEPVEMKIYASAQYDIGSILVSAELNGKPYAITETQPYVFRDYGNYRVTVKATYNEGANELDKVVNFTIINPNEVIPSIDLTNLNSYDITKIANAKGVDVTEKFKEILNFNTSSNAMLVSYEKLAEYAKDLGLSTGKQSFEVTYVVKDKDYPVREQTFKFTLNNETPKIDCSLEAGKKTTKGFTIAFNAAILYQQVGDAYVMINDEIVATINAESVNEAVSITKTFKEHGDGDYYVQLVGTSGNVWISYKATIKEPLNFWAVVVIIVIVAVVLTVTITIIVLRNKMKIR